MKAWCKEQLEFIKGFFKEDSIPGTPSHKNLIALALVVVFCIAFVKKIAGSTDIPDIPSGWQLVLLGVLGIRSAQAVLEKKFNDTPTPKDAETGK